MNVRQLSAHRLRLHPPGGPRNLSRREFVRGAGGAIHLYGPTPDGSFDPIDAEPSLITNFNGVVGLAYISGMVTRTNISTGERVELPFLNADMRFMQACIAASTA